MTKSRYQFSLSLSDKITASQSSKQLQNTCIVLCFTFVKSVKIVPMKGR